LKPLLLASSGFFLAFVMPSANYEVGQTFPLQFAWRLPQNDYVRAVFLAQVLDLVPEADKYIVRLTSLEAGRQEDEKGEPRMPDEYSTDYWTMIGELVGRKITVAYEADDGRALYMRLATLTGEHGFFSRYEDAEVFAKGLAAAAARREREEKENAEEEAGDDHPDD
jgi:hypothetical protein